MLKLNDTTYQQLVKDDPEDRVQIEVGDSKQPDFKPQVKIMRWDNEVNFSMRAEEKAGATLLEDKGVVKYITPDYEVHQYDKPDASEEGGFEFEWVLNKKPISNVLSTTIETKGLDFFYQPELTQEEIAEGGERPENVIGSYAVYHSTKSNHKVGDKNYKSGKAFHIYRPKAIDTNNNESWCELNIGGGILTVTTPQKFLDTATYPVRIDPTFGYTSIGATFLTNTGGSLLVATASLVNTYTATAGDSVTDINIYGDSTTTSGTYDVTVYTISGGAPTTRLATPVELTVTTTLQWHSVSFSQSLSNGVEYGVAFANSTTDTNNKRQKYDSGSAPGRVASTSGVTSDLKDPFGTTGTDSGTHYSIYATYTTGGGAPAVLPHPTLLTMGAG